MLEKYYAASIEVPNTNNEKKIVVKDEISEEEYRKIINCSDFLKDITPAIMAYHIVERNGRELLSFLSDENLRQQILVNKIHPNAFATDANRIVFNFCASMRTFVDHAKTAVKRKGADQAKDFEKTISQIFDESVAYRFFEKLRNFIIHYAYPFTELDEEAPNSIKLICKKDYLLRFDKWGIVKKDLMQMPEEIDIRPLVEEDLVRICSIYIMMYYYYAKDYCNASSIYAKYQKKYDLKFPTIMSIEGGIEGKKMIHPLAIKAVLDGIEEIKHNPHIDLFPQAL